MKKRVLFLLVLTMLMVFTNTVLADKKEDTPECTTIQSGELYGSDGDLIVLGYNEWGYNYQAKIFNGMWCDYHPVYRPGGAQHNWCVENFNDVKLSMKWNDAWLSNKDCFGDGLLDRHLGFDTYIGSGAWLTNHETTEYMLEGEICKYDYFVKIIAPPADAEKVEGIWYTADNVVIGSDIWGSFAIIQEVWNDPCAGISGLVQPSPDHPGLGNW